MRRDIYHSIRVVGVEDGTFTKNVSKNTLLVAVLTENNFIIDCLLNRIAVDGLDATEKLIQILRNWTFGVVMLAGVSFGGFNLVDPWEVYAEFRKPIIIVTRTRPNNVAVKAALVKHFKDWKRRWNVFEKLGPVYEIQPKSGEPCIFAEVIGARVNWVSKILHRSALVSRIPEPLRVARLIARGLTGSCGVSTEMS